MFPLGIVVERPGIRKRPVEFEEVLQSSIIVSFNGLFRHIMPAHPYTPSHAGNGKFRRREPEEKQVKGVASLFQRFDPVSKGSTGKGCLESSRLVAMLDVRGATVIPTQAGKPTIGGLFSR